MGGNRSDPQHGIIMLHNCQLWARSLFSPPSSAGNATSECPDHFEEQLLRISKFSGVEFNRRWIEMCNFALGHDVPNMQIHRGLGYPILWNLDNASKSIQKSPAPRPPSTMHVALCGVARGNGAARHRIAIISAAIFPVRFSLS